MIRCKNGFLPFLCSCLCEAHEPIECAHPGPSGAPVTAQSRTSPNSNPGRDAFEHSPAGVLLASETIDLAFLVTSNMEQG
jgi:hypothetical protein